MSDHGPAFSRFTLVLQQSRHEPRKKDQAKLTIPGLVRCVSVPVFNLVTMALAAKGRGRLTLINGQG